MLLCVFVLLGFVTSPAITRGAQNGVFSCSSGHNSFEEFKCHNGTECIDIKRKCDGIEDCADASDEALCLYPYKGRHQSEQRVIHRYKRQFVCRRDELQCSDGSCIPFDGKCATPDAPFIDPAICKLLQISSPRCTPPTTTPRTESRITEEIDIKQLLAKYARENANREVPTVSLGSAYSLEPPALKGGSAYSLEPSPPVYQSQKGYSAVSLTPEHQSKDDYSPEPLPPVYQSQKGYSAVPLTPEHQSKDDYSPPPVYMSQTRYSVLPLTPEYQSKKYYSSEPLPPVYQSQKGYSAVSLTPEHQSKDDYSPEPLPPVYQSQKGYSAVPLTPEHQSKNDYSPEPLPSVYQSQNRLNAVPLKLEHQSKNDYNPEPSPPIYQVKLGSFSNDVFKQQKNSLDRPQPSESGNGTTDIDTVKGCVLPEYPEHGTYKVENVPNAVPGQSFDSWALTVSCHRGYGVAEEDEEHHPTNTKHIYCIKGKLLQSLPKCVPYCRLPPDPSVQYTCEVPGTHWFKPCEYYVAPGTNVNPVCNSPIYYSTENFQNMKCNIDGTWDFVARCKPDCGRVTPEGTPQLIGGAHAKRGELPWHAGIFLKTSMPYMQVCGGSLIANNVVISAAHCFWKDWLKKQPASNYAVAVGKIYRPWNNLVDVDAQNSDVKEIKIPELFQGSEANFQEDIAVLILATPVVYKTYVRPVCLNFDSNFDRRQLQDGKMGKVAGWGLTEANGNASQVLKVVDMPFINVDTCINAVPLSFREYITSDKICAGYTNGTAMCKGDSGGGLAFPAFTELNIERYYLRGVVSTAPTQDGKLCNDNTYTTFTRISKHADFIKESVAASIGKKCPLLNFQCADGTCLEPRQECNGIPDCKDGSDELEELCGVQKAHTTP